MKNEIVSTSVKLPADLAERIGTLSLMERRSRNAEIIVLLEEALEARGELVPA